MIRMAKPSVRDIAAKANVSPATVSNALNGKGGVSKAVAEQIHAIAREMGYQVQQQRRSELSHNYVRLVVFKAHGMVIMDTMFFAELIEYVQQECGRAGLELVITHIKADPEGAYRQRVHEICNDECRGILLLGTEMHHAELELFSECRSPLIVLDNAFAFEKVHTVVMDNHGAAYLAVKTLYDAGHRRIGHVTSKIRVNNIEDRKEGFFRALGSLGLQESQVWEVTPSIEGAYQDMKAMLAENKRDMPTAIFAANDLMAIGCMRALTEAGYRIPADVSIIGMDDTAVCLACTPPLTTLHVYRRQLALTAVHMLLHIVPATREGYTKAKVDVDLVIRDTVKQLSSEEKETAL